LRFFLSFGSATDFLALGPASGIVGIFFVGTRWLEKQKEPMASDTTLGRSRSVLTGLIKRTGKRNGRDVSRQSSENAYGDGIERTRSGSATSCRGVAAESEAMVQDRRDIN